MTEFEPQPMAPGTIQQLDSAVTEVFDVMLGMACSPVVPRVQFATSLTVTIGLSGQLHGTCWLYLSHAAAQAVLGAMLGASTEGCNSMTEDAARELCNMIVGCWKSKLPPPQASALLSLPIASYSEDLGNGERRVYSFDGNLLALALSIREGEQNYLTTD